MVQLRKTVDLLKTNAAIAAIRYGHFATFFPSAVSTNSSNSSNKKGDAHRPKFCQLVSQQASSFPALCSERLLNYRIEGENRRPMSRSGLYDILFWIQVFGFMGPGERKA